MARIRIQNLHAWLETAEPKILSALRSKFTVQIPNWNIVKRFSKNEHWRGLVSFVDKKGRFPTGLLSDVLIHLRERSVPVECIDERSLQEVPFEPVHQASLPGVELRDYQVDIANKALEERRGIVKCATGGGKTLIFSSILNAFRGDVPTVVLFRTRSLVNQTYRVLQEQGLRNLGRVSMEYFEPNVITCSTIQSAHKIGPQIAAARCLIVDEVHEFSSAQSVRVLRQFKNAVYRLGFSATPWREGDMVHQYRLKSWFGPQLCDLTTAELQARDILAQSIIHFYPIREPRDISTLPYEQAEERGIYGNEYLHAAVKRLVDSIPSGRILVLVKRIRQGDALSLLMPEAFWIHGADDSDTREFVFRKLSSAQERKVVAIASPVGYVGIDVHVHHVINAAGGLSPTLTLQKIGRGLRKAPDKERLDYHDFLHYTNPYLQAHSLTRMATLQQEGHPVQVEPDEDGPG